MHGGANTYYTKGHAKKETQVHLTVAPAFAEDTLSGPNW